MHRSIIALGVFYALCMASTVPQTVNDHKLSERVFTCPTNSLHQLCCIGTIRDDGSISQCQPSQEVPSRPISSGGLCSVKQSSAGYVNTACCTAEDSDLSQSRGTRWTGCVSGSVVSNSVEEENVRSAEPARKAERRAPIPSALKLLGLPMPKPRRVKSSRTSSANTVKGAAKRDTSSLRSKSNAPRSERKTSEDGKAKSTNVELPAAQTPRQTSKKSQAGEASNHEAHQMRSLPPAPKARVEKKFSRRSTDESAKASTSVESNSGSDAQTAAERVGLPTNTEAERQDTPAVPDRSGKVKSAIKKLQSRKINIKAPRWVPATGFLFIG